MLLKFCFRTLFIPALLTSCGGSGGSGSSGGGDSGADSDPCGNALGNGSSVITGPTSLPDRINTFDSPFRSLSVHPTDPLTVYVGTEQNGILRSEDGGNTWVRLRNGIRHSGSAYPEIYDIAISTSDPNILLAATSSGPGLPTEETPGVGGLYKSTDGGDTWTRKNCGLPNAALASAYISPTDSDVALVGLGAGSPTFTGASASFYPGGVYRTNDGGDSWVKADLGALEETNTFYQLIGRGDEGIYTFGINAASLDDNSGFFRSTNNGQAFEAVSTPLNNRLIAYITVSADGERIIFMEQDQFQLNVSENAGKDWMSTSLVTANGPVKISPHDKDRILVADNEDLWFSDDGLVTASNVVTRAIDFFQDIEFSASDSAVAYAVTRGYDFYRSTNGGESFDYLGNLRTDVINVQP